MKIVSSVYLTAALATSALVAGCSGQKEMVKAEMQTDTIRINQDGKELALEISFMKGPSHNHPTFAVWIEDPEGKYLRTVFVTKSIATGIFGHGTLGSEKWSPAPGPQKRPAALPYWLHKRSEALNLPLLPDPLHPVLDGYTGATPTGNFVIQAETAEIPANFRLLFEINQPWDWNEFWTNGLYDDADYRTSCQPSLIYAVNINREKPESEYYLNPIGHGHYAGKDGKLYTDLRSMTTALEIIDFVKVKLLKNGRS